MSQKVDRTTFCSPPIALKPKYLCPSTNRILSITFHIYPPFVYDRCERNLLQEKASQLSTRLLDIEDENSELREQVT